MLRLKSMTWMAAACLVSALVAAPVAAQEALGISSGPGPVGPGNNGGSRGFAGSPAVESISGGGEFVSFYADSTGDVVGFRFLMNSPQSVLALGVWNADTVGGTGLDSDHEVGIWDSAGNLLASATVTPASTPIGDFLYESISPVVLNVEETYTIGAVYTQTDDDAYVSNPTVVNNPEVTLVNAVFPSTGSLGFVFPTEDSAGNPGRFGPNFIFGEPLPESVPVPTLSGIGLLTLILTLGVASILVFRLRQA